MKMKRLETLDRSLERLATVEYLKEDHAETVDVAGEADVLQAHMLELLWTHVLRGPDDTMLQNIGDTGETANGTPANPEVSDLHSPMHFEKILGLEIQMDVAHIVYSLNAGTHLFELRDACADADVFLGITLEPIPKASSVSEFHGHDNERKIAECDGLGVLDSENVLDVRHL